MNEPKVGDPCKADWSVEGEFDYGHITKIGTGDESGLVWAELGDCKDFCGDKPTRKDMEGNWIFDGF